jgi:hypothetical protein
MNSKIATDDTCRHVSVSVLIKGAESSHHQAHASP